MEDDGYFLFAEDDEGFSRIDFLIVKSVACSQVSLIEL